MYVYIYNRPLLSLLFHSRNSGACKGYEASTAQCIPNFNTGCSGNDVMEDEVECEGVEKLKWTENNWIVKFKPLHKNFVIASKHY